MQSALMLVAYAPLALAAVLPVLVLWDSSIRRQASPSWPAVAQGVFGLVMLLCGGAAVVQTVQLLADYDVSERMQQTPTLLVLAVGEGAFGVLCLATLGLGLARPAKPVPRRGLTTLTLVGDVAVVGVGIWYVAITLPLALAGALGSG